MALEKVSLANCIIFALALAEVSSWTIDLPEVRKYFFERSAAQEKYRENYKKDEYKERVYYNNIEGNSKHNSGHEDVYEHRPYAEDYEYQSYMEKKVNDIVYNGSVYLEGLRRSLEHYSEYLENCTRMESLNRTTYLSISTTWSPPIESPSLNSTMTVDKCRNVTRASEHIRRLSALALWATRELQDIAYSKKYDKDDPYKLSVEENELILKLAWFLDRIAHHTGYEPQPGDFLHEHTTTTTSTTVTPVSMVNPSEEVKQLLLECLNQKSNESAVDRCRYPGPLPPMAQQLFDLNANMTGTTTMSTPTSSNLNLLFSPASSESRTIPITEADPSSELLIASDNLTPTSNSQVYIFPPYFAAVKNIKKRSVLSMPQPEVRTKRSNDNPAMNFLNYYTKHKVWEGSNSLNIDTKKENYDVKNQLTSHNIEKRAVGEKRFRLPENPFQDLSKYVKHKPGINYIKDETQLEKIKAALEKMRFKPSTTKDTMRKLTKLLRQKRYVKYEKDVDKPRESVEPQKDISFYIKNKPELNYNNDVIQAVRLRAGLTQIFNTGNIEVVRRYGANFNPLIPSPFFAGVMKTMADF